MWAHFYWNDIRVIAHYLGMLVILMAAIMAVPLLVSLAFGEWEAAVRYVAGAGFALAAGSLLRMAKINPGSMERHQAIAITGFAWVIGAFVAAVPLWLSGHYGSFLDAFFEGVSGLTATGITMTQDVDHLAMGDNMWRFALQFLGGQGVVVTALSLGLFTRVGSSFYNAEGRQESVLPNIVKTAQFIWSVATVVVVAGTVVTGVLLMTKGMAPARGIFHGLWLTIASYDTGGFAPQSSSIIYYHSWALEIIAMAFMFLGAINFALIAQVHRGRWREFTRDIEVRTLLIWTFFMVAAFVAADCAGNYLTDIPGLVRRGIFTIVSATTNTGLQILTDNQMNTMLTSGTLLLVALSMAIGGSAGSTAGGIKALRVGIIFKGLVLRVKALLLPPSAQVNASYNHIGRHLLTNDILASALVIAALYVMSYVLGALAGIICGYEALPAIFDSISAASNAGMTSGVASPEAPVALKVVYIIQMWMGRLEFLTLLALAASIISSILPVRKIRHRHRLIRIGRGGEEE